MKPYLLKIEQINFSASALNPALIEQHIHEFQEMISHISVPINFVAPAIDWMILKQRNEKIIDIINHNDYIQILPCTLTHVMLSQFFPHSVNFHFVREQLLWGSLILQSIFDQKKLSILWQIPESDVTNEIAHILGEFTQFLIGPWIDFNLFSVDNTSVDSSKCYIG